MKYTVIVDGHELRSFTNYAHAYRLALSFEDEEVQIAEHE